MYSIILRSEDKISGDNNNFTIEMSDILPSLPCGCKYKIKLSNCIITHEGIGRASITELRIKMGSTTLYDSKIKAYSSELIYFIPDTFDNSSVWLYPQQEVMVESINFNNIEIKLLDEAGAYITDLGDLVPTHVIIVLTCEKV